MLTHAAFRRAADRGPTCLPVVGLRAEGIAGNEQVHNLHSQVRGPCQRVHAAGGNKTGAFLLPTLLVHAVHANLRPPTNNGCPSGRVALKLHIRSSQLPKVGSLAISSHPRGCKHEPRNPKQARGSNVALHKLYIAIQLLYTDLSDFVLLPALRGVLDYLLNL